ncbi:DNA polymerase III subunit delta' [Niveibacterium sp. 24ML]|uniref:DNA polymerase III subunit delta' n=1 Tax=Niveibacterium sp. 24ML TaxID=2985512 RepID=UPI002270ABBE|nr:DNA polymerase III subunit delta' [Niveibacterium sp. 24ML]MCX9156733.1 DNA polymerase III subunit delta' [Niveibacterium sp. 24ML]
MILPWHHVLWTRLAAAGERGHHALLLAGPAGGGKRMFAEALAAARLCDQPGPDGHACGTCEACVWRAAGTHPDLFRVVPEADELGDDASEGEKENAKSRQIKVEQIRQLQESLTKKGHRDDRRIVLVDPAEAMNAVTANGLLKLLEEPPQGVLFLLITRAPDRLLATLRSRSQRWDFPAPEAGEAARWLAQQGVADAATWLGFAGGMPVAAQAHASGAFAAFRARFVKDIASLPQRDPVELAGAWDTWLRSKDAQAAGFDMPCLADWLLRWYADIGAAALGAPIRFFRDAESALRELTRGLGTEEALGCYNDGLNLRRVAAHPLNARLLLEDTLLRYCRRVASGRKP